VPAPAAVRSDAVKLGACRFLSSSAEVEGISVLPIGKGDDTPAAETTSSFQSTELNRRSKNKPPHFLSPVNMSEGQLSQPPLQLLHNQYRASGIMHVVDFEDCYTFTEMELDGRTMYHSTFTCPGTGCTFHSGTPFQSKDFPGLPGSADDCVTFTAQRKDGSSSSSSVLESRSFYGLKKVAQHAAAARAIDCISLGEYRRFNGDEAEIGDGDVFRLCSEDPYMPPPFSVSSAATSTTATGSSSVAGHLKTGSDDDYYFLSPKGMKFTGPAEFLNNNMDKFHPEISARTRKESKFCTYSITDDQRRTWWTATYTDPLSGQVFKSGILKSDPTPPYEASLHEPKVQGDKVYYAQKKVAVSAAAARAIDCLSLVEFNKQKGEDAIPGEDVTRLCVEEPFTDFDYRAYELESESDRHNYFLSPRFIKFSHPKDTLHNHMRKFHPDLLVDWKDKCFQTELVASMDDGVRTNLDESSVGEGEWWTATYRDPLSGRTFEAGTLTDYYSKPTAFQRHGASRIINGKVCYEQESRAESAAAARAIDCLSLREFQKQRGEDAEDALPTEKDVLRICVEEPFTDFDYNTYEERSREHGLVSEDADYFMSRRGPHAIPFYSAKDFLVRNYLHYRGSMGGSNTKRARPTIGHCLTATTKGDCEGGEYWWTATFKCPETGEEFASGMLRSGASPSEMKVIDDDVCYKNQKMAEHAACSRAIDSLSFREFLKRRDTGFVIDEMNIMRLCEEEPYLAEIKQPSVVKSASPSPSSNPQRITLPLSLTNEDIPVYARGSSELDAQISATVADTGDGDSMVRVYDNLDDAEYAEDDHVVQLLPGTPPVYNAKETPAAASAGFGIPTTMERILAAWADAPSSIYTDTKATIGGSELVPVENRFTIMESVSNSLAWFHRLENGIEASNNALIDKNPKFEPKLTVGTLRRMPVSVSACNAILRALAEANAALSFHDQSTLDLSIDSGFQTPCIDKDTGYIESLAKEILDRVQNTNTEEELSPMSTSRRPNVETFNTLIGCIRRRTSFDTAVAAESVLSRMLNAKEGDMPRPNVGTFNAVIDLWAAVPGKQGRKKVEELFSKMIAESSLLGDDSALRPNRDTFISALHGLTQFDGSDGANSDLTFAEDDSKYWIERMKVLAAEYGDDSLLPDTEAYNAPLRWSGSFGQHAANWDDYASIYEDGFVDESVTTSRDKNAETMERWLLGMEELSKDNPRIHPTIESYESIIQAWVRTGRYKGVLRAEEWAKRVIETASTGASDLHIYPRFQTFHPIIAAWAYCGHPERVKQWDDTLEGISIGNLSELKPDGRIMAALIVAWRERQRLYSEENAATDSPLQAQERVDASFDAAKTSMAYLEDLCALAQGQVKNECNPFVVFDASSAEQVVDSLGSAAHLAASCLGESNDSASATSTFALEEMFRAVALIDELIDRYRTAPLSGINQETAKQYRCHMNHLMSRSSGLYAKVIGHIRELDSERTSSPSLFASFLPSVEKLLRRSEFYDVALIPQGPSARKERREFRNSHEVLRYADSFSYDTLNSQRGDVQTFRHHHYDLFSNILDCCESLDSPSQYGDAIRLIMFMQKHILISKRKCVEEENLSKLNEQVIGLVSTLVTDETEKAAMLKIIHQGVKSEVRSEEGSDVLDDDAISNISRTPSEVTKPKKRVIMKRKFPIKKGKRATSRAGGRV